MARIEPWPSKSMKNFFSGSRRTWSERARLGRKLTQREFVLGLIEEALEAAERQADSPEPEEAGAGPCEAQPEGSGTQPQEEDDPAALSA